MVVNERWWAKGSGGKLPEVPPCIFLCLVENSSFQGAPDVGIEKLPKIHSGLTSMPSVKPMLGRWPPNRMKSEFPAPNRAFKLEVPDRRAAVLDPGIPS